MSRAGFPGFPDGPVATTPMPEGFFSDLLARIDHLGELKLTAYAIWALARQEGRHRFLARSRMIKDPVLQTIFPDASREGNTGLTDALERSVARGVLLAAQAGGADGDTLYFLNSSRGREALRGLEKGEWRPDEEGSPIESVRRERPNVFTLYEQNIGPLTPMIADLLRDAEQEYSMEWVEKAIRAAVERNARHWRYIAAVLSRWKRDGMRETGETGSDRRRYVEGEYADYIKH